MVTAGKGGTGKSFVTAMVGLELALLNQRTLLIELDSGLRGLDIMLGVENQLVYGLGDVLQGTCEPIRAIVPSSWNSNLSLLGASGDHGFLPDREDFLKLCRGLSSYYDVVLVDTPAGVGRCFEAAAHACQQSLLVVTPDPVCVRDARVARDLLGQRCPAVSCRLVINRVRPRQIRQMGYSDLDQVIDGVGAQLIGVVPEEELAVSCISSGKPLPEDRLAKRAFHNIARRLLGDCVELAVGA